MQSQKLLKIPDQANFRSTKTSLPTGLSTGLPTGGICNADRGQVKAPVWKYALEPAFLAAWQNLSQNSCEPNPFYESWNLIPALEAFDRKETVKLFQFWQDGILCGLLPVEQSNLYYKYPIPHLCSWLHDNAFCGAPLVRSGYETAFWDALFQWASGSTNASLFFHLSQLPETGPLFSSLQSSLHASSALAAIVRQEQRALLQSSLSPDAYLTASMDGKKRKELRRQFNRLSELGKVETTRLTDAGPDTGPDAGNKVDDWITQFLTLEHAGWKGREKSSLISNSATENYFRAAIKGAAQNGALELLALTLNDRPIAMLVNFITPPGAFSFKTAFDEDYSRFSPGVLLQRENLSLLERSDVEWTDSCAAADHPMIDRIWREKRKILRINVALGGALRRAAFGHLVRAESNAIIMEKPR